MRAGRGVLAVVLGAVLAGGLPAAAGAEDTVAFRIRDPRITESSGLARDVAGGLYWTINDSGADPVVYGLEPDGRLRGTFAYRATPRDVEAIAVRGSRLYVADIGDNNASRTMVTVYYFTNPRATGLTVTYNAYDFRYPDGAHDAETLLVDDTGRLYLVTKGAPGGIYAAPQDPSRSGVNRLTRVADAPSLVTDGVFLPDGRGLALLTYGSVEILDPTTYQSLARAPIPAQPQAESLAVSLEGDALLVGSEGRGSKVYSIPIPAGSGPASTPASGGTAAPTAAGTPADSGEEDPGGDAEAGTPTASRRGTVRAVGLAAVVAVVAGVVVAFARRPG
ncbi:MAG: hypothetical protein ACJ72G_03100 [Friedmanniella sp.]